ncbi:MAG: hypothetical protein J6D23_00165 [Clostridia bacterium]|nr:hypothetical protein [Clostridia bacterium]
MKYTHPAYINEKIETVDVICASSFTIIHESMKDEEGNEIMEAGKPVMKTVIKVDVSKLF